MRCRQASELISSHIDGELPSEKDRTLKSHLEACPRCAGEVVALRDLRRRLRSWDEAENRIAPSRSFRRRVMDAVRRDHGPMAPATRPVLRRLRGETAQRVILVAGSLAAAVLLLATGLVLGALDPSASPATPPVVDDLETLSSTLDAADVEGRLDLARRYELRGDPAGARGQYLHVLSLDPGNSVARVALGLGSDAPVPGPLAPADRSFRDRLGRIPTDVRHPELARALDRPENALDEERIEFEGHEIAKGAVRDYEDILDRDRRIAVERAHRGESVARGTDSVTRPGNGLTGTPRVIAAYVSGLEPVQPGSPNRFDDLVVLPVLHRSGRASGVRIIAAQEALRRRILTVSEERRGRVVATNHSSDVSVFIPSGTIFAGRSQDRVTGRDVLVRTEASTHLSTFCCEEGRSARAATFSTISGLAGPGIRRLILREADQSLIWARIKNQARSLHAVSRTHALRSIYESVRIRNALDRGRARLLPLLEDVRVVGFVAADGDRILGADVFGNHDLFRRLAGHYLESYLVDAFSDDAPEGTENLTPERARTFLHSVAATRGTERAGANLGREARFDASGLFAYGLAHDGKTVHVSLFPVRGGVALSGKKKSDPSPSVTDDDDDGADDDDGGSTRRDPTGQGKRVRDRQDGARRGAPARPRPVDPPSGANRPGSSPNPPSRSPRSDFR